MPGLKNIHKPHDVHFLKQIHVQQLDILLRCLHVFATYTRHHSIHES
jgi:hypothetical protein